MHGMKPANKQIQEVREPISYETPANVSGMIRNTRGTESATYLCSLPPLIGWRAVKVTDRRTKIDWAESIRELVDNYYPDAERILLVMDNLNTHSPSSLYEAFEPEEAKTDSRSAGVSLHAETWKLV